MRVLDTGGNQQQAERDQQNGCENIPHDALSLDGVAYENVTSDDVVARPPSPSAARRRSRLDLDRARWLEVAPVRLGGTDGQSARVDPVSGRARRYFREIS
ncbi:hypothetical protein SPHINGOAX6_70142 [Sphingomonas sp. AX6]|nr:hypothetical protein SPHINGOAX6_70142 [Sphingomonas sp. AX6]